jgi:hypothetical protein
MPPEIPKDIMGDADQITKWFVDNGYNVKKEIVEKMLRIFDLEYKMKDGISHKYKPPHFPERHSDSDWRFRGTISSSMLFNRKDDILGDEKST